MKKCFTMFIIAMLLSVPVNATPDIASTASNADCKHNPLQTYSGTSNLQADWTANTINLHWYDGDTELTVPSTSQSCTYDGTLTPPETIPTKTGYTFKGWTLKHKNLYNKATGVLHGYPTANYTWYARSSTDFNTEFSIMVELIEGQTYTATRTSNSSATFRIQASDTPALTNGQSLQNIDSLGTTTINTKTFTVPAGYPYVIFYVRNTSSLSSLSIDDVINGFQVEKGSIATDYEPYHN